MARDSNINLDFATNIDEMFEAGITAEQMAATFTEALNDAQKRYDENQKQKRKKAEREQAAANVMEALRTYINAYYPDVVIDDDFNNTGVFMKSLDNIINTTASINKITKSINNVQKREEKESIEDIIADIGHIIQDLF